MRIHNCHTHIFTNRCVPDHFLKFGLYRLFSNDSFTRPLGRFINTVTSGSCNDIFDQYTAFANIGNFRSQEAIFDFLARHYPKGTVFAVLSIDMEYMGAGKCQVSFEKQLEELADIRKIHGDTIRPFICADPRRPAIADLVKRYIEEEGFAGVKLYPALGFYPFDERLYDLYSYCQNHAIPVMTHCSAIGIHFNYPVTREMLVHPKTGAQLRKRKKAAFAEVYSHPENYAYVLDRFPELKLCFSHLGGSKEWHAYLATRWDETQPVSWLKVITDLIRNDRYPNLYGDIAYVVNDPTLMNLLKALLGDRLLRSRILLGTDFYIAEKDISERAHSIDIRGGLSPDDYRQIAEANPMCFLSTRY
ncbi:MAG: amidohydrolase family protein [Chitinispirillaceae bacterium]|nr:amidohydrolase family protein [Chitinispirillaceae bacterium]